MMLLLGAGQPTHGGETDLHVTGLPAVDESRREVHSPARRSGLDLLGRRISLQEERARTSVSEEHPRARQVRGYVSGGYVAPGDEPCQGSVLDQDIARMQVAVQPDTIPRWRGLDCFFPRSNQPLQIQALQALLHYMLSFLKRNSA